MNTVRLISAAFLLAATAMPFACTSTVPPQGKGGSCIYDQQCDSKQGLVCRCAIIKVPDDEGPDQITKYGVCDLPTASCVGDGGTDVGGSDVASEAAATDAASEAAPTDAASEAAATDAASEASATDAASEGG